MLNGPVFGRRPEHPAFELTYTEIMTEPDSRLILQLQQRRRLESPLQPPVFDDVIAEYDGVDSCPIPLPSPAIGCPDCVPLDITGNYLGRQRPQAIGAFGSADARKAPPQGQGLRYGSILDSIRRCNASPTCSAVVFQFNRTVNEHLSQ